MSRAGRADGAGMTTFEDLDIGEAFGDFGDAGTEPLRRSRAWGLVASLIALVLVALGLVWLNAARDAPTAAASPESIVPALGAAQTAADTLTGADLDSLTVLSSSTRLLGTSEWGSHYAALSESGAVCLVTVLDGQLPAQACGGPNAHLSLTTTDLDGRDVVLLTAQDAAPTSGDGWHRLTDHLWTRP